MTDAYYSGGDNTSHASIVTALMWRWECRYLLLRSPMLMPPCLTRNLVISFHGPLRQNCDHVSQNRSPDLWNVRAAYRTFHPDGSHPRLLLKRSRRLIVPRLTAQLNSFSRTTRRKRNGTLQIPQLGKNCRRRPAQALSRKNSHGQKAPPAKQPAYNARWGNLSPPPLATP